MDKIKNYQRNCWQHYKKKIGLPQDHTYLCGHPVKVHVPIDTARNGLMFVGAYPTAHFQTIGRITDVPVADHLYPFSSEKYFDGTRVRTVNSGAELQEHYLTRLGVSRDQCWITDLVKVFLFKQGHVERYRKLGRRDVQATRNDFKKYAKASLSFLYQEIELAQPKAILLLGLEVISVVLGCSASRARSLIGPDKITREAPGAGVFFALPHPGIVMRNSERGLLWRKKLHEELTPAIRVFWQQAGRK